MLAFLNLLCSTSIFSFCSLNSPTPVPPSSYAENLDVHIENTGTYDPSEIVRLYDTLISSSDIHSLSLKISEYGCTVSENLFAFPFQPGDRFPPLKILRLKGYDFDDTNSALRALSERSVSGIRGLRNHLADEYDGWEWFRPERLQLNWESIKGSNLRMWRDAMDWSQLEELELRDLDLSTFFKEMSDQVHNLKHLSLQPRWSRSEGPEVSLVNSTETFVQGQEHLERLSLQGYTSYFDALRRMLERHGPSLRALQLREWESTDIINPRAVLSSAQLLEVKRLCPQLERLSIDLNRNGTWPTEIFNALSMFEGVQHLEMNLELGSDRHVSEDNMGWESRAQRNISAEEFRQPSVNAEAATWLLRTLKQHKKGAPLQNLTITIGDWGKDTGGAGYYFLPWETGLEEKWECQVHNEEAICAKVGGR
ncbi:MAG: hypothetical protein LQ344_001952 [Seirophora lacunosa]|nr:MAG: hypothetical protein LQ344_001952 [Seirophora lacunosa]